MKCRITAYHYSTKRNSLQNITGNPNRLHSLPCLMSWMIISKNSGSDRSAGKDRVVMVISSHCWLYLWSHSPNLGHSKYLWSQAYVVSPWFPHHLHPLAAFRGMGLIRRRWLPALDSGSCHAALAPRWRSAPRMLRAFDTCLVLNHWRSFGLLVHWRTIYRRSSQQPPASHPATRHVKCTHAPVVGFRESNPHHIQPPEAP